MRRAIRVRKLIRKIKSRPVKKKDDRFYMHMRKKPSEWSMATTHRIISDK